MDLEHLTVAVRPRSYAEAIDLGFGLGRRWWRAIVVPWLLIVLPLPLLGFVFLYERPGLVAFVVWWLKPLYDRIPLHVISRAFFGDPPSPGETVRALPNLLRRRWLVSLTLLRLDPMRAVHLPVSQLEGLRGPELTRRRRVVSRGAGGHAMLVMGTCVLFEALVAWMPLLWIAALLPQGYTSTELVERLFVERDPVWVLRASWVGMAAWIGAVTFVEPLFVAAGFALYINRRTLIEAWDIEVAFRRMARRLAAGGRAAVILAAACWFGATLLPTPVTAQTVSDTSRRQAPAHDPEQAIEEVLADHVFGFDREVSYREFRWNPGAGLFGLGALAGRVILAVLLAIAVYVLVRVILHLAAEQKPATVAVASPPPEVVVGLEVTRESLPDDVPAQARALWAAGDRGAAVRLLYRAALTHLIHRGLPVRDSATEGDCLRLARAAHAGALAGYFERLTHVWVRSAYGHEGPADELGDELIGGWEMCFGSTP